MKNKIFLEKAKQIHAEREKEEIKVKFANMKEDIEVIIE